jgi:hypothetical protein
MSVPMVSTNAMTKIVRTTGKNPQVNRLCRSNWKEHGLQAGRTADPTVGAGATLVTKLRRAVARTPVRIAAGKRRIVSTVISRKPKIGAERKAR